MGLKESYWADVAEFQGKPYSDFYLSWNKFSGWASFRCNDGTYQDQNFTENFRWARNCARLVGYIVYIVFPPSQSSASWHQTYMTFVSQIGQNHDPRMVVMIDVESWGKTASDRSPQIRWLRRAIAGYLNSLRPPNQRRYLLGVWYRRRDLQRVIVYGNAGDLRAIVSNPDSARILLADYTDNKRVPFPGKIAQQYTSSATDVPPWKGQKVDVNYAPVSPQKLAQQLGLGVVRWSLK